MKVTFNVDIEIEADSPQEAYKCLSEFVDTAVENGHCSLWNSINFTTDEDEEIHEMDEAFGPSYDETHSYTRNAHTCVGGESE